MLCISILTELIIKIQSSNLSLVTNFDFCFIIFRNSLVVNNPIYVLVDHDIPYPQESEDMWHIYNLLSKDDTLRASTFRKVVKTGTTGTTKSDKIRLNLTLEVCKFVGSDLNML